MQYKIGNLLEAEESVIAHGINMRGPSNGLAKLIWDTYPEAHDDYIRRINTNKLVPGATYHFQPNTKLTIHNLTNQVEPGPSCTYNLLYSAVRDLGQYETDVYQTTLKVAEELHLQVPRPITRVAIPRLGCGIGGLKWTVVSKLLLAVEAEFPTVEFIVYDLPNN